jgi:hypothetical protein
MLVPQQAQLLYASKKIKFTIKKDNELRNMIYIIPLKSPRFNPRKCHCL